MESMTLGSPVGSPQTSSGSSGTSAYLPGFLLGDTVTPTKIGVISPQETPRHLNTGGSSIVSAISHYGTPGPEYRNYRQKAVFGNASPPSTPQIGTEIHAGGPPTRGLFDVLESPQIPSTYASPANQSVHTPNQSRLLMNASNNMLFPESTRNLNTSESQGLLQWVTIFGYPPSAINTVLSYISSRVRIIDKHSAPQPQCNWIHIKCTSEQEAQRALACNGSIVSGSIMIGIIPCTDEGVILGCGKENLSKLNGSMRSFTALNKINQLSDCNTPRTPIRIQNARPLTTGYNQRLSPQSVTSPENIPQKSTGLVSQAMEYIFGW